MGLIKLVIFLDQPVYYPGQIMSGKLVVEVDKPMSMQGIYLKYSGEATVRWTETQRRHNKSYTVSYSNSEQYLELRQLVFGNGTEDCELATGEHVYIFNHQLPINLPNSFEGSDGHIRYSIKATINRRWKFDHIARQPVMIVSICDLNHIPLALVPIEEQSSKLFWGHSEPLSMAVHLPIRGYVPGQIMPIKVLLNNQSEVQVVSLRVTLEQNVSFHATSKSKYVRMIIFKNEFPVSEVVGCKEVPLNLQLPAVPPTYLGSCRIISLNYQLKVTARVNAWYHKNLTIRSDVIVGHIPLTNYQTPIPGHQILQELNGGENSSYNQAPDHQLPSYGFVSSPEMTYDNLPPSSYEQTMKTRTSV